MYRKAFETCAAENLGFKIRDHSDTSSKGTAFSTDGNGTLYASNYTLPGSRMLIQCDGPIDERMGKELGLRKVASTGSYEIQPEPEPQGALDKLLSGKK